MMYYFKMIFIFPFFVVEGGGSSLNECRNEKYSIRQHISIQKHFLDVLDEML